MNCFLKGTALGTVIAIPTAGLIAGSLGWEAVFYLHGALPLLWCVLWVIFVTDTPLTHRFIEQQEVDFITASTQHTHEESGGGDQEKVKTMVYIT